MKNIKHIISLISNIRDKSNRLIISELEKNNIIGIVPSHGNILQMLFYSNDIVTMQDIAKKIHRNKSTVTTLVNKLVKLGYVKKSKDLDDSRTTIISLTKKGWELKPIFDEISEKLLSKIYTNFTNEQQKEVIDALEKINKNL